MTLDPATLPIDAAQLIALLLAAHARADALEQRATDAEARSADLDAQIATLKLTIAKMKRAEHGVSSEKSARLLDQLELQLGELVGHRVKAKRPMQSSSLSLSP